MNGEPLDPREHPYLEGVAASYLRGRVDADRFVDGEMLTVIDGVLEMRSAANPASDRSSELLFGEKFMVYDSIAEWCWGQSQVDGYVGYVRREGLMHRQQEPTHEVSALRTNSFVKPDLKTNPVKLLHMTSRVAVTDEENGYYRIDAGGWVTQRHLVPIGDVALDIVASARCFMHTPYLWGGRSSLGLDCSALVQFALMRSGRSAPRDADQQELSVGAVVDRGLDGAMTGDLLYLKGHVVIVSAPGKVLHANAHHMAVAEEPLDVFLARMRNLGLSVRTVRRL